MKRPLHMLAGELVHTIRNAYPRDLEMVKRGIMRIWCEEQTRDVLAVDLKNYVLTQFDLSPAMKELLTSALGRLMVWPANHRVGPALGRMMPELRVRLDPDVTVHPAWKIRREELNRILKEPILDHLNSALEDSERALEYFRILCQWFIAMPLSEILWLTNKMRRIRGEVALSSHQDIECILQETMGILGSNTPSEVIPYVQLYDSNGMSRYGGEVFLAKCVSLSSRRKYLASGSDMMSLMCLRDRADVVDHVQCDVASDGRCMIPVACLDFLGAKQDQLLILSAVYDGKWVEMWTGSELRLFLEKGETSEVLLGRLDDRLALETNDQTTAGTIKTWGRSRVKTLSQGPAGTVSGDEWLMMRICREDEMPSLEQGTRKAGLSNRLVAIEALTAIFKASCQLCRQSCGTSELQVEATFPPMAKELFSELTDSFLSMIDTQSKGFTSEPSLRKAAISALREMEGAYRGLMDELDRVCLKERLETFISGNMQCMADDRDLMQVILHLLPGRQEE